MRYTAASDSTASRGRIMLHTTKEKGRPSVSDLHAHVHCEDVQAGVNVVDQVPADVIRILIKHESSPEVQHQSTQSGQSQAAISK